MNALAIPTIETFLDQVVNTDALTLLNSLPSESVDLFVTSPPYNILNTTGGGFSIGTISGKWVNNRIKGGYGVHDDNMPHEDYVKWQRTCLAEMMRCLKPTGAIYYNHKWRVQGGLLQTRFDILDGFPLRQIVIWQRDGGFNFNKRFYLPTTEQIFVIAKPDFEITMAAVGWGDVWNMGSEKNNSHPAPFPVELPRRCIASQSSRGIVCDPFGGSGTTAVAARQLGWHYILSDNNPEFCQQARTRIRNADPYQTTVISEDIKQPSLFEVLTK